MRRILGVLALVAVLAGCGGTDWDSAMSGKAATAKSAKSAKAAKAAKAARLAAATAKTERSYVNALVATAANEPGVNALVVRCTASAIVKGYGVAAFKSAGITTTALRRSDSALQALPAPTAARIKVVGAAFQKCGLGTPAAQGLASGLGTTDAAAVSCMARRLDTDPAARRLLVFMTMNRPIDLATAHTAVGVVADCVDLPTLFVGDLDLQLDNATRACLVETLKGSEAKLKDYVAEIVAGETQSDAVIELRDSLSVDINRCRPSARTGFTVPAASG